MLIGPERPECFRLFRRPKLRYFVTEGNNSPEALVAEMRKHELIFSRCLWDPESDAPVIHLVEVKQPMLPHTPRPTNSPLARDGADSFTLRGPHHGGVSVLPVPWYDAQ